MSEREYDPSSSPIDPEEFDKAFTRADHSANQLHSKLGEGAQLAGYVRMSLRISRKIYSSLAIRASEEPELIPIVKGAIDFVNNLAAELDQIESNLTPPISRLYTLTSTAFSFTSSSGTLIDTDLLESLEASPFTVPPFLAKDRKEQARKFDQLDEILGETYRGAWETYHGGTSDPLRGALYLMRQTFDHLFDLLAPVDQVRESEYFEPKAEGNEDAVHRVERIRYAAATHVADEGLAIAFTAAAPQVKSAYDELSRAHKRGEIDHDRATGALVSISSFLEEFVSAIDIANL